MFEKDEYGMFIARGALNFFWMCATQVSKGGV